MTTAVTRASRTAPSAVVATAAAGALAVACGVAFAVDVRMGAAIALAAVGVPLALLDLPLVIAAWAALTVFSRHGAFGQAATAAALLALGGWLAHARAERGSIRAALRPHRRLLTVVVLLLGWLTLSLAWTAQTGPAASKLAAWYVNAAALVVLLTSVRTPRAVRLVVGAVVLAVVAAVGLALAGVDLAPAVAAEDAAVVEGRLQGVAGDPNFMAAFIVPALVVAAALRASAGARARPLLVAAVIVLVVGLAATQSRGGLLAALVALVAALLVMRGRRGAVLGAGAVALLVLGIWLSANPAAIERLQSAEQDRGNGREDLWLVAWRMSGDHPITGVGLDGFTVHSGEYVRRPGSMSYVDLVVDRPHVAHNTYLEMLAESGVVGLGLTLALAAIAMSSALSAARRFERAGDRGLAVLARGVVAADAGLLTAAFFISAQATATVWVLLALGPMLLGVALVFSSAAGARAIQPHRAGFRLP
jgi:O-antigen ligase